MKQTPRCALYRGVRLHGVHHTAKSSTAVCIPLRSQVMNSSQKTPRCASCCGVNNLSSVCFNPKFYKCYFSVMPKIFIQNWYCKSQMVQGIFFTTKVFWKNEVERCSKYENTKNRHFRISLTLLCASHRGVKRYASHCGVKVTKVLKKPCSAHKIRQNQNLYESLGAFRGKIRRNPFRGEQFYHKRKDLKKFFFICYN